MDRVKSHHVLPFFNNFLKDVVESVELLDGLLRLSVQSHQDKLFNRYMAEGGRGITTRSRCCRGDGMSEFVKC